MEKKAQETVAVFGAGIGGLTAAHELVKRGFRVRMYEKRAIPGGLARSDGMPGTATGGRKDAPGEYGWRVYGARYYNLLEVLADIPLGNGRTVRDNLVPIDTYLYPRDDGRLLVVCPEGRGRSDYYRRLADVLSTLSPSDLAWTVGAVLFGIVASSKRIDSLDDLPWIDFLRAHERSPEFMKYLVKTMGPYYGMDPHRMSTTTGMRLADWLVHYTFSPTLFYMMNAPTNEAWFDPWVDVLRRRGVEFCFEHRLAALDVRGSRIVQATVEGPDGALRAVDADYYVSALPVEAMARLIDADPALGRQASLARLPLLARRGRQNILCLQYFFEQRIRMPEPRAVIHLLDTPWAIIIEPEGGVWNYRLDAYGDGRIRDVWSVGPCDEDTPGILFHKTMRECTPQEIEQEVWAQLMACRGLVEQLRLEDGRTLEEVGYKYAYVWPTVGFRDGRLTPEEPKFSNNVGTLGLRPRADAGLDNLFLSAGYAWTPTSIFSMETACEAGRLAANAVMERSRRAAGLERVEIRGHGRVFEKALKPLRAFDAGLFRRGIPHPLQRLFGRRSSALREEAGAAPLTDVSKGEPGRAAG